MKIMKKKIFYGLGLLAISSFGFMVNTNALDVSENKTLTEDVKDGIVVKAGSNVTIDLGGFNVTNTGDHTIKIEKGATLVITGNGTVTNATHAKAPVYNDGIVTIKSGTYSRIDSKDNSYYVLLNHGTMTIDGGKYTLENGISSLIDNGWYTASQNTSKEMANLTINGGTFEMTANDKYIKNDDFGIMTINGGTFNMYKPSSAVIANVGFASGNEKVVINDGIFNYYGTGKVNAKGYAIWDYDWSANYTDNSTTIVKGGTYNLKGDTVAGITNGTLEENKKEYKVIGSDEYIIVKETELVKKTEITALDEDTLSEKDKTLIDKVVTDKKYTLAGNYNIDLFKATKEGLKVEQIPETDSNITVKIQLPESLAKVKDGYKRTYYVIRIHDGVTTVLDAVDNGDGTISFKTDKFSTYSVVYTDAKISNPETSDNIVTYAVILCASIFALGSAVTLRKRYN